MIARFNTIMGGLLILRYSQTGAQWLEWAVAALALAIGVGMIALEQRKPASQRWK